MTVWAKLPLLSEGRARGVKTYASYWDRSRSTFLQGNALAGGCAGRPADHGRIRCGSDLPCRRRDRRRHPRGSGKDGPPILRLDGGRQCGEHAAECDSSGSLGLLRIETAVKDNQSNFAGTQATVRPPFLLQADGKELWLERSFCVGFSERRDKPRPAPFLSFRACRPESTES